MTKEKCRDYLEKASFLRAKELVKSALQVALDNPDIGITDEDWIKWAKNYPEMMAEVVKLKMKT